MPCTATNLNRVVCKNRVDPRMVRPQDAASDPDVLEQVLTVMADRLLAVEAELAELREAKDMADQMRADRENESVPMGMYL